MNKKDRCEGSSIRCNGGKQGKGVGGFRGIIVFLQLLWEWKGSVQREERARQGCLKRVCPRALSTDAYKWSQKVGAGRTDRKRPRLQWTQSQLSTHRPSPYEKRVG